MTTNSCGSALPAFDFPQNIAKVTRAAPKRLPMAARLVPLAAAAGLAYYATSSTMMAPTKSTVNVQEDIMARRRALEHAYGARSSLDDLEAATLAYELRHAHHNPVPPEPHPSRCDFRSSGLTCLPPRMRKLTP
ncbi:hypothetical protein F4780DRAFT_288495 [Xylariomycetidae sp. FL0641]|nr:hypothetical protein F4780DRAFT_288495 [Xylariomycetidae sp. FL0641]